MSEQPSDDIVQIGPHKIRLTAPASYAACSEIQIVAGRNFMFGLGSALGACWRGAGRPKVEVLSGDYGDFGRRFLDACLAEGYPPPQLRQAAIEALKTISTSIESRGSFWDEVEEQLGNSEGETAAAGA